MWILLFVPMALTSIPNDTSSSSSSRETWTFSMRSRWKIGVWAMIGSAFILLCFTEPSVHHQLAVRPISALPMMNTNNIVPISVVGGNDGGGAAVSDGIPAGVGVAGAATVVGMEQPSTNDHSTTILFGMIPISECAIGTIMLFIGCILGMIRRRWVKIYSTQFGVSCSY
jgi:hypothetical protein